MAVKVTSMALKYQKKINLTSIDSYDGHLGFGRSRLRGDEPVSCGKRLERASATMTDHSKETTFVVLRLESQSTDCLQQSTPASLLHVWSMCYSDGMFTCNVKQ